MMTTTLPIPSSSKRRPLGPQGIQRRTTKTGRRLDWLFSRLCLFAVVTFAEPTVIQAQHGPEMLPTNAPASDTERLIDFVLALRYEALPAPVVKRCKELIADSISTMALGAAEPQGQLIRDHIHALQLGMDGGPSTVFGAEFKAHPALAAFANGCQAQIHDVNDGPVRAELLSSCAHPGRYVVPVALACGEAWRCSGRQMISAAAAGYEFAGRTQKLPLQIRDLYVATVVAGKLAGLTGSQLAEALVLCAYNSPGRHGHTRPEADEYWLTCGNICRSSVEGVLLIKAGAHSVDLRRQKTQTWTTDLAGLGKQWAVFEIYQKPYPVCRNIHAAVDLVRSIAGEHHLRPADIASINIARVNGMYVGYEYIRPGATRTRAQFDIHHCVACAIIAGTLDERHTGREWIDNAEVRELARKVTLTQIVSPGAAASAEANFNETEVVITTTDGRKLRAKTKVAWGDPAKPFSADERRRFFAARVTRVLPADQTAQLYEAIERLDVYDSLAPVSRLLAAPAKTLKPKHN
jgi:2-methylcitrate dehydratase PrpD